MKINNLELFIITGVSGAGKTQTLKCLEDLGFYCIDNLPVNLIPKFIDTIIETEKKPVKIGLGLDIRASFFSKNTRKFMESLTSIFRELKEKGIRYKIIYLDADNNTLVKRFSETRRKHPIGKNILSSIKREKKLLSQLKIYADKIIDTSNLILSDLKSILISITGIESPNIIVNIVSFGYKYGLPIDADILMDVRFLSNPNYVLNLKNLTGNDKKVKDYVLNSKITRKFLKYLFALCDFLLPQYVKEGKSYLTIGCGCTGGRHRSVTVANALGEHLKNKGYPVKFQYRDIKK